MQIQTLKKLIMMGVLGVFTTVSAHAQSGSQFTVKIPFNFYVGGKTLSAGEYTVGRSTQASSEAFKNLSLIST
jgi:fluoride ion exporter CrcB/FEX